LANGRESEYFAAMMQEVARTPRLIDGEITASITYDIIAGADDSFHGSSV
jgi:hypothetical protein